MGRIPKRVIRNPQTFKGGVLTPVDQLHAHYGGRAGMDSAIESAAELARQLSVLEDPAFVGPGGYRDIFPEIDYQNYDRNILIGPAPEMPEEGVARSVPGLRKIDYGDDPGELTELIVRPDGKFTDFHGNVFDPEIAALNKDIEAEGRRRASVARSVEKPMTELITGFAGEQNPSRLRQMGNATDKTLAQIRRASGLTNLDPSDAEGLIQSAYDRAAKSKQNVTMDYELPTDSVTGLPIDDILALGRLPPAVQALLSKRIRELLTLGGVTTGLLSSGESSDRKSIDPSSTTGPLSGLTDY